MISSLVAMLSSPTTPKSSGEKERPYVNRLTSTALLCALLEALGPGQCSVAGCRGTSGRRRALSLQCGQHGGN